MGTTRGLPQLAGRDWPVPDYSTVSRRQKALDVAIEVVSTATGLHLLVDSAGIKMLGEGDGKLGSMSPTTGANGARSISALMLATLEIRAMEVTDNSIGNAPMLPNLLGQIPPEEQLASARADGAYDTKGCHEAIMLRQADAIIPTRKNAKLWKTKRTGAAALNEILRATRQLVEGFGKKGVANADEV
jgi:hypothetical protein